MKDNQQGSSPSRGRVPDYREVEAYLDRELPMEREREIEAYFDTHPALWEAIEGWMELTPSQRQRARSRLGQSLRSSLSLSQRKRRRSSPFGTLLWFILALVILLGLAAWGYLYYLRFSSP